MSTNTVWGYMIGLKHVISIARNSGALPFNPFAESVSYTHLQICQNDMELPCENTECEYQTASYDYAVE